MSCAYRLAAASLGVLACATSVLGDDFSKPDWEADRSVWSVELEGGIVATSGNSNSRTYRTRVDVRNERPNWRHRLKLSSHNAESEGEPVAERYVFDFKTDYKFSERQYLFGTLRYERDRFGGIDYRASQSVGYGHRFFDRDWLILDAEVGAGYRRLKAINEPSTTEAILRNAGEFRWDVTEASRFTQEVLVETSEEETFSEAISRLRTDLNDHLGLQLSYTLRHRDSVPAGNENTDTIVSANLSYEYER